MKKILTVLAGLSLPLLTMAQSYVVQLQSGNFLPAEHKVASVQQGEHVNGRFYRIIQFYQIPTDIQKRHLEQQGIRLYNYLPNNCFMASFPVSVNLNGLRDNNIRSVFSFEKQYKLTPDLLTKPYPSDALRSNDRIELIVSHHPDIEQALVAEMLQTEGFEVLYFLGDRQAAFRILAKTSDIEKLASLPYLYFIEPAGGDPQPENLVGRTNHRSNVIAGEHVNSLHYDGTGVSVALNDDGVIGPHIDYTGRIISQYISFNNGNHGDHCAGTIFGAGNIDPTTKGMAFGAQLGVYGVGGSFANYYQGFDSIYSHYTKNNIRITSTSYSDGNNSGYTSRARLMDIHINTMQDLIHVFSAGNAGTANYNYGAGAGWGNITGGHKQAKNVIAVGNLTYQDALASSSSRGPAKDGRIKPDICAVGSSVNSTINPHSYELKTGTSMACPGVAGTIAQLYHAYKDLNAGANPPSALIKAAVLNTGDDLGNPGPDYRHGYGRINAGRALTILQNNQYLLDSVSQNNADTHTIAVPSGVAELRVMVYWHDKEATAGVAKALVNNLNMTVTTPTSQVVNPWILNPTPNVAALNTNAVQGVDTLNNVEQVTVTNPSAGNYTVTVNGFAVPNGPQKYVVVYEFVKNEIKVTYPNGGESFVPGVSETIRWDAYGNTGNFSLQYSTNNGTTWTNIASVAGGLRYYNWTPPSIVNGQVRIRVSRSTISDISDTSFSIIGVPAWLSVDWVCVDSMQVSYTSVTGATGYVVSVLGAKYMDSAGFSTTNSCIVRNINTLSSGWFSVHAVGPNGCVGRRALAKPYAAAPVNCIVPDDLGTIAITSPKDSTVIACQGLMVIEPVTIDIRNNGLSQLSNATVKYSVNGSVPVAEVVITSIAPQTVITHTFAQPVVFSMPGTYTIHAWVEHPSDMTYGNDTVVLVKGIIHPQLVALPVMEDFEAYTLCDTSAYCETVSCPLSGNWYNETNQVDDDIDWRINSGPTPTGAAWGTTGPSIDLNPGTATGQYAYLEAGDCYGKQAGLVSSCINPASASIPLLRVGYHMKGNGMGSLHIDVQLNGQWTNDIVTPLSGDQGNSWSYWNVPLNNYIGQVINIRIRGITGGNEESDIAIDDISVIDAVGIPGQALENNIQLYPNPSDGLFHLSLPASNSNTEIKIMDVSGRVVQQMKANSSGNSIIVDINIKDRPSGIYLLSVKNNEQTLTRKLVKE